MSIKPTAWYLYLIPLFVGVWIGYSYHDSAVEATEEPQEDAPHEELWTCSMHPQIRQPEAGKCPICGMALIAATQTAPESPNTVELSPTALQLAHVHTSVVALKKPIKYIRVNGKVKPNEQAVFIQTSHLSGRIERLLVDYVGESVARGQVIAYVYSPELVTAQEELFIAQKMRKTQPDWFRAAQKKLKNRKLTNAQIRTIIASNTLTENFPILSDMRGVVLKKNVKLGDHVSEGYPMFEIADLSTVWIQLDVYEKDLAWVKVGDGVTLEVSSLPAEVFHGKISFIDPVIDPIKRVARARVAIANAQRRLKPEMLVTATIASALGIDRVVVAPKSAVLWTGKRSVVYVKVGEGQFELQEVSLGASLEDDYMITEGLSAGDEIVTRGAFSLDAAAQLAGKPSMMSKRTTTAAHQEEAHVAPSVDGEMKKTLARLLESYIQLKNVLTDDDEAQAIQQVSALYQALRQVQTPMLMGKARTVWAAQQQAAGQALQAMKQSENLPSIRVRFADLSRAFILLTQTFKPLGKTIYLQHCPMALDNQGADWMSLNQEIKNPYFGASMISCGEVTHKILKLDALENEIDPTHEATMTNVDTLR